MRIKLKFQVPEVLWRLVVAVVYTCAGPSCGRHHPPSSFLERLVGAHAQTPRRSRATPSDLASRVEAKNKTFFILSPRWFVF